MLISNKKNAIRFCLFIFSLSGILFLLLSETEKKKITTAKIIKQEEEKTFELFFQLLDTVIAKNDGIKKLKPNGNFIIFTTLKKYTVLNKEIQFLAFNYGYEAIAYENIKKQEIEINIFEKKNNILKVNFLKK